MTLLLFLLILSILVLVHEGGHFLAAKKAGIKVEEFGFGYPPRIWAKKIGETEYSINAIPFGGFVRLYGDPAEGEVKKDRDFKRSFLGKSKKAHLPVEIRRINPPLYKSLWEAIFASAGKVLVVFPKSWE